MAKAAGKGAKPAVGKATADGKKAPAKVGKAKKPAKQDSKGKKDSGPLKKADKPQKGVPPKQQRKKGKKEAVKKATSMKIKVSRKFSDLLDLMAQRSCFSLLETKHPLRTR